VTANGVAPRDGRQSRLRAQPDEEIGSYRKSMPSVWMSSERVSVGVAVRGVIGRIASCGRDSVSDEGW